ncbi:MAG: hypothetical protein ACOWWM_10770 [Desulfobacterales bacterium]
MGSSISGNPMVWVYVQTVDGEETFAGQYLKDLDVSFLPFFMKREEAAACLPLFPRRKGAKVEFQAVRYRELAGDAARNGFLLFLLDEEGAIIEKIDPAIPR